MIAATDPVMFDRREQIVALAERHPLAAASFELVLNLKTAKRLGISVPPKFPVSVDEVIE